MYGGNLISLLFMEKDVLQSFSPNCYNMAKSFIKVKDFTFFLIWVINFAKNQMVQMIP